MDGFAAFKYYVALKLHFSNPKFNVFANKARLKGTRDTYGNRPDVKLFEKLARQFDDRQYIQYIASNLMYGNTDPIYNHAEAMDNYKEFLKRKQSITRVFANDLDTILNSGAKYNFSGLIIPDVIQLLLAGKITLETVVILDSLDDLVTKVRQNNQIVLLLGDELIKIEKAHGFVKFNMDKVKNLFNTFKGELKLN